MNYDFFFFLSNFPFRSLWNQPVPEQRLVAAVHVHRCASPGFRTFSGVDQSLPRTNRFCGICEYDPRDDLRLLKFLAESRHPSEHLTVYKDCLRPLIPSLFSFRSPRYTAICSIDDLLQTSLFLSGLCRDYSAGSTDCRVYSVGSTRSIYFFIRI